MSKKEQFAFGIFQDGLTVKIAQLVSSNEKIKIQQLLDTNLSHHLFLDDKTDEKDFLGLKDIEDEFTGEASPSEEISEFEIAEEVEEEEEEEESGKSELQSLLVNFPLDRGKISLNASEEQISYHKFDKSYTKSKIIKYIKKEVLSKDEIKKNNYSFGMIFNKDKSSLAFVHKGENDLLNAVQELNFQYSRKKYIYSYIDTNEISLMNLVRYNYEYTDQDFVMILYIGKEYKSAIVMRGKDHFKTLPIIVPEAEPERTRQSIFSKILLEQDISNFPITQNILIAGEFVSKKDIEFFAKKFGSMSKVSRLELPQIDEIEATEAEITDEKIAQYAIPIALAWKTLDHKNKNFYSTNLLPKDIIERQKHFKVAWHGFVVLAAIFFFALTGTIRNLQINRDIIEVNKIIGTLDGELTQTKQLILKINEVKEKQGHFQKNLELIDKITGNKNQWYYILNVISEAFNKYKISWLNDLKSSANKFQITGYTSNRRNILKFAELFPNGRISRIIKENIEDVEVWKFDISYSYPKKEVSLAKNLNIPEKEPSIMDLGKESEEKTEDETEVPVSSDLSSKSLYEVSFFVGNDHTQAGKTNNILENAGYNSRIEEFTDGDEIAYKLVLNETFSKTEAENMGDQVKKQFNEIDYFQISEKEIQKKANIPEIYNDIAELFFSRKIDEAYDKLNGFIKDFPGHRLVYNANYLRGECLYYRKEYTAARKIFEKILLQKGNKKPDALMMLGNSYKMENNTEQAVKFWNRLIDEFPENELVEIAEYKIKALKEN